MKKLIFLLFALISFSAQAQEADTLQVTSNPELIDLNDTDLTLVLMPRENRDYSVTVKFPSTNVGTIQINSARGVMTLSPTYAASATPAIIYVRGRFWIKFSNSADTAIIEF